MINARPCGYSHRILGTVLLLVTMSLIMYAVYLQFGKARRHKALFSALQTRTSRNLMASLVRVASTVDKGLSNVRHSLPDMPHSLSMGALDFIADGNKGNVDTTIDGPQEGL